MILSSVDSCVGTGFGARTARGCLAGAGGGFGAGGRRTMDTVLAAVHSKVSSVERSSSVSALSIWYLPFSGPTSICSSSATRRNVGVVQPGLMVELLERTRERLARNVERIFFCSGGLGGGGGRQSQREADKGADKECPCHVSLPPAHSCVRPHGLYSSFPERQPKIAAESRVPQAGRDITCTYCCESSRQLPTTAEFAAIERCAIYDLGPSLDADPGTVSCASQPGRRQLWPLYICVHPADGQLTGCSLTMVSTS